MNRLLILTLGTLLLAYGAFEARRLLEGPQIVIHTPLNGSRVGSTTVTISGKAENIAFLTVNDAPAFTDSQGDFSLTFSPPPGLAIFTVAASDRFGRRAWKTVSFTVLNYCPT